MVGDLAERRLKRAQRLGRTRPGGLGLDPAQPLGQAGVFGAGLLHGALEASGDGDGLALSGLDAGHGFAKHGLGGDGFRRHPRRGAIGFSAEALKRHRHAALAARMSRPEAARRRFYHHGASGLRGARRALAASGALLEIGLRGDFLGRVVLEDHAVQPFAEGHAGPAREVLRDLPRLRVDPLDAPGRTRRHIESFSQPILDATTDPWCVNGRLTLDIGPAAKVCGWRPFPLRKQASTWLKAR